MCVHFPKGLGGLGVPRGLQASADVVLRDAGGTHPFASNPIGYGMAAPTLVEHARPELTHESGAGAGFAITVTAAPFAASPR
jgi:hypothetical protein